jgi:divalent metal cation (Fe/Co/Zn/Cd) transporter
MGSFGFPLTHDLQLRQRAMLISVVVGIALLVIKFLAATFTGSAAILSDA